MISETVNFNRLRFNILIVILFVIPEQDSFIKPIKEKDHQNKGIPK